MRFQLFKTLAYTMYGFLILIALLCAYLYTQAEYQALKKYYPELTFRDYVILGDKLRITPNGE